MKATSRIRLFLGLAIIGVLLSLAFAGIVYPDTEAELADLSLLLGPGYAESRPVILGVVVVTLAGTATACSLVLELTESQSRLAAMVGALSFSSFVVLSIVSALRHGSAAVAVLGPAAFFSLILGLVLGVSVFVVRANPRCSEPEDQTPSEPRVR